MQVPAAPIPGPLSGGEVEPGAAECGSLSGNRLPRTGSAGQIGRVTLYIITQITAADLVQCTLIGWGQGWEVSVADCKALEGLDVVDE